MWLAGCKLDMPELLFNLFLILVHEVIGKYCKFLNVVERREGRRGGKERGCLTQYRHCCIY